MNEDEKILTADKKPDYAQEIIAIIRGDDSPKVKLIRLEDYHENDIAEVISELTVQERKKFYHVCPAGMLAEIFEYFDEDEIGSRMSTNFVVIRENLTIKQAMNELAAAACILTEELSRPLSRMSRCQKHRNGTSG